MKGPELCLLSCTDHPAAEAAAGGGDDDDDDDEAEDE